MATRRNFTDQFKAKVALEALRGAKTVQEIAGKHQLHPNQVSTWKRQAIDGMADVFSGGKQSGPTEAEVKELHAKIGRLTVENDAPMGLRGPTGATVRCPMSDVRRAEAVSPEKKRAMIKRDPPELSISQQGKLVRLSRSAFYDTPVGIDADTRAMMKEIDRVFTKYPFFGSRQIAAYLRRESAVVGRHRVRRLMAKLGLEAIYNRPRTRQPHPQHPVFPYLLRKMQIDRPNQVWCADITFVPVRNGFLYLAAIMDWASRKVQLAAVKHDACRLLRRCAERSHRQTRTAGDHDHRSRVPVHGIDLDHNADRGRHAPLNGWARPLSRYHLYRTAVAQPQAGGDPSRRHH